MIAWSGTRGRRRRRRRLHRLRSVPECHYPVAIEQIYAVLEYVAEFASEFGADPRALPSPATASAAT